MNALAKLITILFFLVCCQTATASQNPGTTPLPQPSERDYFNWYLQVQDIMYQKCSADAQARRVQCEKEIIDRYNSLIQTWNDCWLEMNNSYPGQPAAVINQLCESQGIYNTNQITQEEVDTNIYNTCEITYQNELDNCRNY
jgi:hypothetical protein